MTEKERVIAAINHIEPDKIPYEISLTWQEREIVDEYVKSKGLKLEINSHVISAGYCGNIKGIPNCAGYYKDEYGVIWNRSCTDKEIGVIDDFVLPEPNFTNYTFPQINEESLREIFKTLVKNNGDAFRVGNISFTMFERAWVLRGMENLLVDMIENEEFVDRLFNAILQIDLKIMKIAFEYEIDGFDDWGQQKGLIMGPIHWRRFIKPRIAKLYQYAKQNGKFVMQHSCGDIEEIFPDLIEIGLDVYQTFQPEIYDMVKIKRRYGSSLTIWGGISTQRLLPYASPEEVKAVTKKTMEIMGTGGGYIAAPTHGVPSDVPPENILTMLEVFENQ